MRKRFVEEREWIEAKDFEDGIAATNLLPGPASTQLSILCAWKLRGAVGALVGGVSFIVPGLTAILALSAVFLSSHPPLWVLGAAAGASAAVPAVAVQASAGLAPAAWRRVRGHRGTRLRWLAYLAAGATSAATIGPFLVLVLLGCGLVEAVVASDILRGREPKTPFGLFVPVVPAVMMTGGIGALAWVAFKVGALSYGGGFVIIPLMQHDAVHTYHWMTAAQFLDAVALGQVTPGPVVQTVAVVGYAAAGVAGGLLAAAVAFGPSFGFVIAGAPHFDRLRHSHSAQVFLTGAGAAAIGAIAGSAIPLALSLSHLWQAGVLLAAAVSLLAGRRGVVLTLLGAGALGVVAALAGAPVPH
jgi:chromate transporter